MTRSEHLAWAKQRALEFVGRGELDAAIASMLSDLGKHRELERSVGIGALIAPYYHLTDYSVRHWIEGFN